MDPRPVIGRRSSVLRRGWRTVAGVATFVLLEIALAFPVNAASPQPVTIHDCVALATHTGTFSTSGAFSDAGTTVLLHRVVSGGLAPFLQATIEFDGSAGSFVLQEDFREFATSDPNLVGSTGEWHVVSGTGGYALLQGRGRVHGVVDIIANTFCDTFDGAVHV
jgi:hypothetical protein